MVRFIGIGVAVLFSLVRTGPSVVHAEGTVSTIKADEQVVFFPTAAHLSTGGQTWTVPVHGWIFEPEEDDVLRQWFIGELENLFEFDLDRAKAEVLNRRLRPFLVDNERGKEIAIRIAGAEHTLPASERDGHFWGTIELPAATVEPLLENGRLPFHAIMRPDDPRDFSGVVHCLSPTGISVISDIDDTIKVTDVRNSREVIENTFFREFRPVDGMSEAYRHLAGASFHYVSSSPWQLYEPLAKFNRAAGFPDAIFHLKRFRLKDSSFLSLFTSPFDYKISVIAPLIESFPQHQFVLVGDSGEKDPEAYAAILRRFPMQVLRIYIRDVTNEPATAPRYRETFSNIAPEKWQVFTDPATLEWPEAATSR
jgi:Uncharacterized conserved protein (DUF2183)